MGPSIPAILGLGFMLGVRHSLDADHVAAVSTLVSQQRRMARSCLLGILWGAGHTVALLVAGMSVIAFKMTITPEMERGLEIMVACVLIILAGRVIRKSFGGLMLHRQEHSHGGFSHDHPHFHVGVEPCEEHDHLFHVGGQSLLIGVLHGLAGSAALMLLVLTAMPSLLGGLLYIFVFGIGSTGGMLLLSGFIGIPFRLTAGHSKMAHTIIQTLMGGASLILGLAIFLDL